MLFGDAKRGKPISASDLRALAAQSQRGKTAVSGGMGHIVSGGGSGDIPQSAELFLAIVTAASGSDWDSAVYGFEEANVIGGAGGTEARTSGRTGSTTVNPARSAVKGVVHEVDDYVLVRRNVASVNEYEIVGVVAAGDGGTFFVHGVLDGDLARDGTATLSVYADTGGGEVDTGVNVTVRGRFVPTGQELSAGSRVGACRNGYHWYAIVSDTCPVDV